MLKHVPRWAVVVLALVLGVGAIVAGRHIEARAEGAGRSVLRWDESIVVDEGGGLEVSISFDYDFGSNPGHGPTVSVVTRQNYDATHDRLYDLDTVAATMDGSRVSTHLGGERSLAVIYIGESSIDDVRGVHTYTLTYSLAAAANGSGDGAGELYWNVFGDQSTVPIDQATITVRAAAGTTPVQVGCYAGRSGSTNPCTSAGIEADAAVFAQNHLDPHWPLTIDVAFPTGTFDLTMQPRLVAQRGKLDTGPGLPSPTSTTGGLQYGGAIVVVAGLIGIVFLLVRRRDLEFVGLAPGLMPPDPATAAQRPRRHRPAIAPRFDPPTDLTPSEAGLLQDGGYDNVDLAAGIVDLAARGYLTFAPRDSGAPNAKAPEWVLRRTGKPAGALPAWEQSILKAIFGKIRESHEARGVPLRVAVTGRPSDWQNAREGLIKRMRTSGWFRGDPLRPASSGQLGRQVVAGIGIMVSFMGVTMATSGHGLGLAWIGAGLLVTSAVIKRLRGAHHARTAVGTALNDQVDGYRRFIATADARALAQADDQDPAALFLFGLPWAMIFGMTERWSALFATLPVEMESATSNGARASEGVVNTAPTSISEFVDAAPSLARALAPAGSAAPASSGGSGGSGFSSSSSSSSSSDSGSSSSSSGSSGGGGGGGGVGGW